MMAPVEPTMPPQISSEFIAAGGNRHPAAADWDAPSGLVAFGAGKTIALWDPLDEEQRGIRALLGGHTDQVTVVKFYSHASLDCPYILSGSVDQTIRLWRVDLSHLELSCTVSVVTDSQKTINAICVDSDSAIFVSGPADARLDVRSITFSDDGGVIISLLQTIAIAPRFFPLALALAPLQAAAPSLILAVGGTKTAIQIYVAQGAEDHLDFTLQATLAGHEGWIRSLAFVSAGQDADTDLLLASASQDKYIRLWRVRQGDEVPSATAATTDLALGVLGKSLSNKAHRLRTSGKSYSMTFEALLLGHEDWIYATSWSKRENRLQLVSASADGSLAIWEPESSSGVWVCLTRLGEIGGQKGATTATGSAGGYWIGHWSPDGKSLISLGRTGGWRLWKHDDDEGRWLQQPAISGHVKAVTGISWATDGSYLLSTSSDQTTRLFAKWIRGSMNAWHELSRPQIHGYDLNCIDTLGTSQFVSGADEKLLRVFAEPRAVAQVLRKLCRIEGHDEDNLPDAAGIPALGLSNKAIPSTGDEEKTSDSAVTTAGDRAATGAASFQPLQPDQPPTEDHLARQTLWPEREKLYGHGFEISMLATSHDGTLVATACRASSVQHAVIRLYETQGWREVKPALTAHNLTVTRLRFSDDDQYLLSVGRDRQWFLFKRDAQDRQLYTSFAHNPRGHSRMLLDAAWAPNGGACEGIFATAGRDKTIKIWQISEHEHNAQTADVSCKAAIPASCAVTAVVFLHSPRSSNDAMYLAAGFEDGSLSLYTIANRSPLPQQLRDHTTASGLSSREQNQHVQDNQDLFVSSAQVFPRHLTPSGAITQMARRPRPSHVHSEPYRRPSLSPSSSSPLPPPPPSSSSSSPPPPPPSFSFSPTSVSVLREDAERVDTSSSQNHSSNAAPVTATTVPEGQDQTAVKKSAPAQDDGRGHVSVFGKPDEQQQQCKEEHGRGGKDGDAGGGGGADGGAAPAVAPATATAAAPAVTPSFASADGASAAPASAVAADAAPSADNDADDNVHNTDKARDTDAHVEELAVASDDGSVRIYSIRTR